MKFYDRKKELASLAEIRHRAFTGHSQMTVVTGRRRIGKTKLLLKSCEDTPTVYLFVSKNAEETLCRQFSQSIRSSLQCYVPEGISSVVDIIELLMSEGKNRAFNLIIDEFQEFEKVNASIFSGIQDVWDRYKDISRVNFLASGSIYNLMHKIFMDYGEPLYGRCDTIIRLRPFPTYVIQEILGDYNPDFTDDDLLCLYTITGGVPKYIELLMDRGAHTVESMIQRTTEENSIFLEEGNILIMQQFGRQYSGYFSILTAIASGRNTSGEISQVVGEQNLGGMLSRLEEDYELISRSRPVMSKERGKNVRYFIHDNFLRWWFRYIGRNQDLVQMGLNDHLGRIVADDYCTYSGLVLEEWFRERLRESGLFRSVGSWWSGTRQTDQSEIDIVAIPVSRGEPVFVAEVKRQGKNFKPVLFSQKVALLKTKSLPDADFAVRRLVLEEMRTPTAELLGSATSGMFS